MGELWGKDEQSHFALKCSYDVYAYRSICMYIFTFTYINIHIPILNSDTHTHRYMNLQIINEAASRSCEE